MKIRAALLAALLFFSAGAAQAALPASLSRLLGKSDSLLVTDEAGNEIWSHLADTPRVPASTLKVLTCLAALETLGPDYRFATEFYARGADTLVIKGYGDPLFVSEVMARAAGDLVTQAAGRTHIVLDDSFFARPLAVPGAERSSNPYDAPVGALCANFNSVEFRYGAGGRPESAETQTPLIPFAEDLIRARKLPPGRVLLAAERGEATLYAGRLFGAFLEKRGLAPVKSVETGVLDPGDTLLMRFDSPYTLSDAVLKLLATSSNFMTNQIFLTLGATEKGAPATFEKGAEAVEGYAAEKLGITDLKVVEGSGLSRVNRITARQMEKVLARFFPYRGLMKEEYGIRLKTGTLSGISTRVGYVPVQEADGKEKTYRVVVFCNTAGRKAEPVILEAARLLRDTGAARAR